MKGSFTTLDVMNEPFMTSGEVNGSFLASSPLGERRDQGPGPGDRHPGDVPHQ